MASPGNQHCANCIGTLLTMTLSWYRCCGTIISGESPDRQRAVNSIIVCSTLTMCWCNQLRHRHRWLLQTLSTNDKQACLRRVSSVTTLPAFQKKLKNKAGFLKSFNSIFGKIVQSGSEELMFELIKSKCLPILLYGTDVYPINSADRHSLQFTVNKTVYKIFGAMSKDLYIEISAHVGIESVENFVVNRRNRFINRYGETDNYLCRMLRWLVRLSERIFIYCVRLISVC